jgi:hypothetical protein
MIFFGETHLRHVVDEYLDHYMNRLTRMSGDGFDDHGFGSAGLVASPAGGFLPRNSFTAWSRRWLPNGFTNTRSTPRRGAASKRVSLA